MSGFLSELEQDPFDGDEFVERLAWRSTAGHYDAEAFDARALHEAFESGIKDLKAIYDSHEKKCERLEMVCNEEEKQHWIKVTQLQDRTRQSLARFELLDNRLDAVSAKVVYLGDQLEGVNTPRARAVEAQKLMRRFARFLDADADTDDRLPEDTADDDLSRLYENADVIQKLHLIAHELPDGANFATARLRIAQKYDQIERELIEEFVRSHRTDNKTRMREMAAILSHFKGYSQCVDAFIEQSQTGVFGGMNVFHDIPPLCRKNEQLVREVFSNADQVMSKFVLNVFHGKLQEFVRQRLDAADVDYLSELFDLYSKTQKMAQQLAHNQTLGCDPAFLQKMTRNIFSRYLDPYITKETHCLREKCANILHRFYDSKNHQKKPIPSGSIQELKRDLQAKIGRANINIGTLANINITVSADNYGGETFLSEEVAISLLQETKLALHRCHVLSRPQDLANNAVQIFDIQMQYLCAEHMDYAIELGLQLIPSAEPKSQPDIHFLDTVRQCNAICHLIEKQFVDCVLPLVASTGTRHSAAEQRLLKRKRDFNEQIQVKLNTGLERALSAIVGWVRLLLQTEQRKTDFKPETDDLILASTTPACAKVVRFVTSYVRRIRDSLDGKNVETVLTELGVRIHRVIFEHFQQFQFTIVGAMVAICDVNEYRRCVNDFGLPLSGSDAGGGGGGLLSRLFAVLHALFNLLIVAPENLKHAMEEVPIERSVLISFVQLRSDYKTIKSYKTL